MAAQLQYTCVEVEESGLFVRACLDRFSERLRVDEYAGADARLWEWLEETRRGYACGKLIVKATVEQWQGLLGYGFQLEGILRGYFVGQDAYLMAYYPDERRRFSPRWQEGDRVLIDACAGGHQGAGRAPLDSIVVQAATAADLTSMAGLYRATFPVYPAPVWEVDHLRACAAEGQLYQVARLGEDGPVVSAAAAEVNERQRTAEIADCATAQGFEGLGLQGRLVEALEETLEARGFLSVYALSRSTSPGMNRILARRAYHYTGRLANNCRIGTGFEDMNVWSRRLGRTP